ncbi:MAG TPA: ASKHA domain-containing protein [Candidatus Acidoferrum sp.]|nr:ASKHA domain-containing protein [Candidatus Angelobacter sp.]HXD80181.1 ASKHA domain-containing protein [Candidatus Acidoferrum sp.]
MIQRKLEVKYLPFDRVTRVPPGTTLFSAAHWIGLPIDSTCGGRGTCGKCKVRVIEGRTDAETADHRLLRPSEIDDGWRLSCQARIYDDIVCEVPQLLRVPKAATMGLGRLVILDPNVRKVFLELAEPDLEDQRSDVQRLKDALTEEGHDMVAGVPVLRTLPSVLREASFQVTAVLAGEHLVAVEPGDTTGECYGVAFDVGTTTLVGTLMNLRTGMAASVLSTLNGQAPFGADVISRISHGMNGPDSIRELQAAVVSTMNGIMSALYAETGVSREQTYEAVVVGNATMLHLLFGIDPGPLAVMPFTPAFMEPLSVLASDVGLDIHPHGYIQTLPALGAYVGADIVAGVLATGIVREDKMRVFVDVGTNGEIVLGNGQRALATAAPAGPAFEGSQIRCGMRATDGAIEGVQLGDTVELQIIGGDVRPEGICGSGLVDAVAQLLLAGLLDHSGRMKTAEDVPGHPLRDRLIDVDGVRAFLLADGVYLTQKDIRELQFAKGSIATGIKVLMDILGIETKDLDEVLLGGSFGSYLNPESAKIIGLVPPVNVDRIIAVGNSAGEGAKIALLSYRERQVAFELPSRIEYVELSGRTDFNDAFVSVLGFPHLELVG